MIELKILGRTELRITGEGDASRSLGLQPKRFALLSYLAVARPRGFQRRDSLLVLFWPQSSDRGARNALNQSLHSLRDALGEGIVLSRGREEIGVVHDQLLCDAIAFDETLDGGRYVDALELYEGELLKGFHISGTPGFEQWLDLERARFRRQAQAAAVQLAEQKKRKGNLVGAARWLERALEISPTNESLIRRLVDHLDRAGDRAGALRAYERFTAVLESQLGSGPSPETRAMVSEVRGRREQYESHEPRSDEHVMPPDRGVDAVAVLPLKSIRGEPEQKVLAEGVSEALIGELARIDSLRVISRQSVLRFEGSKRPLSEIGDLLGVEAVVEGSVLRVGGRMRLSLQLVRVNPEELLWADAFERDVADILDLQRDVARAVADRVAGVLAPSNDPNDSIAYSRHRKMNPDAYDAFLRGVALLARQRMQDVEPAIRHFWKAIEFDPDFGEPLAWIALAYANLTAGGVISPEEARGPMTETTHRALQLDDELGPAHLARALVLLLFERDWPEAEVAFERAAAGQGGTVHKPWRDWLAMFLIGQGRFEQGLTLAREASRSDPMGPTSWLMGWALHKARRFEESIERFEWTLEMWPDYPPTLPFLAASHLFADDLDRAVDTARQAIEMTPDYPVAVAYAAATLARAGQENEARELTRRLGQRSPEVYVDPFNLAVAFLGLQDDDRALTELERLVEEGSPQSWAVLPEPFLDPVRNDPRFQVVLQRLNLTPLEL